MDYLDGRGVDVMRQVPPQVGVIFYLDISECGGGALRTRKGSNRQHLTPTVQHALIESSFPCRAGDAVIIDARVAHSVDTRYSTGTRIAITLWYMVNWNSLSDRIKSSAMLCVTPDFQPFLGNLYPNYSGDTPPQAHCKDPTVP